MLVDAAQSAAAIGVDLAALRAGGVIGYAAAGQKWACGPVGTGALWLDPAWAPDAGVGVWPTYDNLADPASGLEAAAWPDARRLDAPSLSLELLAGSVAALDLFDHAGWGAVHEAGVRRAAAFAQALRGPRRGGRRARLLHPGLVATGRPGRGRGASRRGGRRGARFPRSSLGSARPSALGPPTRTLNGCLR